jgi:peptide-methionine (S)-S-oxide reductase
VGIFRLGNYSFIINKNPVVSKCVYLPIMKNNIFYLLLLALFSACGNNSNTTKATLPKPSGTQKIAVFAGGCFWSIQEAFSELKGVSKATSGYAGGTTKNPTYQEVGSEQTGHAEAVQVIYDPAMISFAELTEAFFHMHDPTQLNRQGPDVGTSYRSIAFYSNEGEMNIIRTQIQKFNRAQLIGESAVTEIKPLETFYPAEKYHQNYVRTHPNEMYVANVCGPKVEKLRKAVPHLLKDEFK